MTDNQFKEYVNTTLENLDKLERLFNEEVENLQRTTVRIVEVISESIFESSIDLTQESIKRDVLNFPERTNQYILLYNRFYDAYNNLEQWSNEHKKSIIEFDKDRNELSSLGLGLELSNHIFTELLVMLNKYFNVKDFQPTNQKLNIEVTSHPFISSEVHKVFNFLDGKYFNPDQTKYTYILNFFERSDRVR
jgi:hypothetical protein